MALLLLVLIVSKPRLNHQNCLLTVNWPECHFADWYWFKVNISNTPQIFTNNTFLTCLENIFLNMFSDENCWATHLTSPVSYRVLMHWISTVKKKKNWECYFVPEGFCHFQTYRSDVEALSHAVSAEGLLPLAQQSLLVALGLIAISATFVPSLTAIAVWPNDNIKSQCTGRARVGMLKRIGCRVEIVMIMVKLCAQKIIMWHVKLWQRQPRVKIIH